MKRAVTWISYTNKEGELGLSIRVSITGKLADNTDSTITKIDDMMRANGFKPREEWRIPE